MKRLKFLGAAAVAALMLTSCLDGGSNEVSGVTYGVVKYSTTSYKNLLYELTGMTVYHVNLEALTDGDCITCYRKINQGDAANKSAGEYWTASELTYDKIDKGTVLYSVEDTSVYKAGEMSAIEVGVVGYIQGMLFVQSAHPNSASDQTVGMTLSYDRSGETETVDGQNVYNLFLRVQKISDGKSTTGNVAFNNVFRMDDFFAYASAAEKAKGKEVVNFRFNYIKEFNADTTQATWATSKVINYQITTSN